MMTTKQKLKIYIKILKEVRNILWDGKGSPTKRRMRFICRAIDEVCPYNKEYCAHKVVLQKGIMKVLGKADAFSVDTWLAEKHPEHKWPTPVEAQTARRLWLDQMIRDATKKMKQL